MSDGENRALSDKFMLRLPDGMREKIKAAAEANNRSMNAEIVWRLEASLASDLPRAVEASDPEYMKRFAEAVEGLDDRLAAIDRVAKYAADRFGLQWDKDKQGRSIKELKKGD